jgi:hypothetical protein
MKTLEIVTDWSTHGTVVLIDGEDQGMAIALTVSTGEDRMTRIRLALQQPTALQPTLDEQIGAGYGFGGEG